jgi:hypothetical protein
MAELFFALSRFPSTGKPLCTKLRGTNRGSPNRLDHGRSQPGVLKCTKSLDRRSTGRHHPTLEHRGVFSRFPYHMPRTQKRLHGGLSRDL